jgi:hypothetical protein
MLLQCSGSTALSTMSSRISRPLRAGARGSHVEERIAPTVDAALADRAQWRPAVGYFAECREMTRLRHVPLVLYSHPTTILGVFDSHPMAACPSRSPRPPRGMAAIRWGADPARRSAPVAFREAGALRRHLSLDALDCARADAEAVRDLVHALIALR